MYGVFAALEGPRLTYFIMLIVQILLSVMAAGLWRYLVLDDLKKDRIRYYLIQANYLMPVFSFALAGWVTLYAGPKTYSASVFLANSMILITVSVTVANLAIVVSRPIVYKLFPSFVGLLLLYWLIQFSAFPGKDGATVRGLFVVGCCVAFISFTVIQRLSNWWLLSRLQKATPILTLVFIVLIIGHFSSFSGSEQSVGDIVSAHFTIFLAQTGLMLLVTIEAYEEVSKRRFLQQLGRQAAFGQQGLVEPSTQQVNDAAKVGSGSRASHYVGFKSRDLDLSKYDVGEPVMPRKRMADRYIEWIAQNYQHPESSVDKAINEIGTSYATLNRHLKDQGLTSSKKLLTDYRLMKAIEALKDMGSSQAGYACGFKSPSHFTSAFRSKYGMTPSEYRKSSGNGDDAPDAYWEFKSSLHI